MDSKDLKDLIFLASGFETRLSSSRQVAFHLVLMLRWLTKYSDLEPLESQLHHGGILLV